MIEIAALSANRLGRRFGAHWALAHVHLEVAAGEVLLIAGANGSGKTTLLRLLCGLLQPTKGEIKVFGIDPSKARAAVRRRLTLVSHHAFLYDGLTARETLELWNRLLPRPRPASELPELLARVGLEGRGDDFVGGFSAGMRKRLTLARTSLEQPDLVLLDEPFAALDPAGQKMIGDWLGEFRLGNTTVVMASHALDRAVPLADRVTLLHSGQVSWSGPAQQFDRGELQAR